jgi:hypothetical protein
LSSNDFSWLTVSSVNELELFVQPLMNIEVAATAMLIVTIDLNDLLMVVL